MRNLHVFIKKMHSRNNLQVWNKQNVIIKVNKGNPWISNFVTVKSDSKDGRKKNPRICHDKSNLNMTVQRESFYYRTLHDINDILSKATYFTLVDFKMGTGSCPLMMRAPISQHLIHHLADFPTYPLA